MNFYDVILAGKLQDMTYPANFFDLLFARKLYPADVWEIYEGTLPATFNANGSDMRQYQIYGNTGGVGDKTVQLFDKDNDIGIIDGKYISQSGVETSSSNFYLSNYIEVSPNETYRWAWSTDSSSRPTHTNGTIAFYNAENEMIGVASHAANTLSFDFTTPETCTKVRASVYKPQQSLSMLTEGSTAPATYIPYGYEVDMEIYENIWRKL